MGKQRVLFFLVWLIHTSILFATPPTASLDVWNFRTTNVFKSIAFGNGTFVGVGDAGKIMTSPDGITWTARTSGTTANLNKICCVTNYIEDPYFPGIKFDLPGFIAVGDNGTILWSDLGDSWYLASIPYTCPLMSVVGGEDGTCVIVTTQRTQSEPNVLVFTNSGLWQPITFARPDDPVTGTYRLTDVASGAGRFVALGAPFTKFWTSTNGLQWIQAPNHGDVTGVSFGNGIFVASQVEYPIVKSKDGLNWTVSYQNPGSSVDNPNYGLFTSVTFGNGTFLVVRLGGRELMTSSDGISWSSHMPPNRGYGSFTASYGNGTFLLSGAFYMTTNSSDSPVYGTFQSGDFDLGKFSNTSIGSGQFAVDFSGETGKAYALQASTNLLSWTTILSFTNHQKTIRLEPPHSIESNQFYRVVAP